MNNTRLHIFPTHGSWRTDTDNVFMLTTVGDLPLSVAYDFQWQQGNGCLADRNNVFEVLAVAEFRNHYDDVIYYSEPFHQSWCSTCNASRYTYQMTEHQEVIDLECTYNVCDTCHMVISPPF